MEFILSAVSIFLIAVGVFFLIRLKGFYFLHPLRVVGAVARKSPEGGISPFRAMTMALAGTIGVGNIVGVASALYLGGAGAIFWMVAGALVAMVLKYAEIVLAIRHQQHGADGEPYGGATYYMEAGGTASGHPKWGKVLACIFAALCVFNAVGVGCILQSNAVAGACAQAFSIPPWLIGGLLGVLCLITMCGGAKRISALTEKLVPLMLVVFLVMSIAVLILRRERILPSATSIFQDAFSAEALGGGGLGFLLSRGIRYGIMRGILSNEAGCGTSPMAHASACTRSPAAQGVWGLFEVILDTVLICSITAFVILVSDTGIEAGGEDAIRTAQLAFTSVLGEWSGGLFAIAVLLFGMATIICWSHYGMTCIRYLFGRHSHMAVKVFIGVYALSVVYGAIATPSVVWTLADIVIALMTVLNLLVLLGMHREVERETRVFTDSRKKSAQNVTHSS